MSAMTTKERLHRLVERIDVAGDGSEMASLPQMGRDAHRGADARRLPLLCVVRVRRTESVLVADAALVCATMRTPSKPDNHRRECHPTCADHASSTRTALCWTLVDGLHA